MYSVFNISLQIQSILDITIENKLIKEIAAKAKDIEKKIKEEASDLEEFKSRGARASSPIKWGDSDEETEARREWRKPAMERIGEKREVDDDRTAERRRKRQRRAREVENLRDDEKALSAKVSDLRTKLFKAGLTENENRGKILKLEKEARYKDDKIKELENKVARLEALNDGARCQVSQLEHKIEIQKARVHGKPLPSANSLDGWILAVRERLASKRNTLFQSADVDEQWLRLLKGLGSAPPTGKPV